MPASYTEWHRQLDEYASTNPAAVRVYLDFFAAIVKENDPPPFGPDNKTAHEEFFREYVRWGYQTTRDSNIAPPYFEKRLAPNTTWAARQYIANYLTSWYEFARDPKVTFERIFDFYQVALWDRMKEDRRRELYAELLEELQGARCDLNRPPPGAYAIIWDELARDYAKLNGPDAKRYLQVADRCRVATR